MGPELFCLIKQVPVGSEDAAAVGTKVFCYINHFGIEFTNPLHFVIFIYRLSERVHAVINF